jgi:polyisoprenoid-binding protein YceI
MKKIISSSGAKISLITLLFFSAFDFANATNIPAIKNESSISYHVEHKLHTVDATTKDFACNISYDNSTGEVKSVTVIAAVTNFNSGNGNLDSHAMEVIEAIKYPRVSFVSNKIVRTGNDLEISGKLTFHGITKNVIFHANQSIENNKLKVEGAFNLSLDEFKVERPSMMFSKLKDEMKMNFKTTFDISEKSKSII